MAAERQIVITGGDPTNPRCAKHLVERLEQIERDLLAMHDEAGRLVMFADLRPVLMDFGHSKAEAQLRTDAVVSHIRVLRASLSAVAEHAAQAATAIYDSKVNLNGRFEWRPTSGR